MPAMAIPSRVQARHEHRIAPDLAGVAVPTGRRRRPACGSRYTTGRGSAAATPPTRAPACLASASAPASTAGAGLRRSIAPCRRTGPAWSGRYGADWSVRPPRRSGARYRPASRNAWCRSACRRARWPAGRSACRACPSPAARPATPTTRARYRSASPTGSYWRAGSAAAARRGGRTVGRRAPRR